MVQQLLCKLGAAVTIIAVAVATLGAQIGYRNFYIATTEGYILYPPIADSAVASSGDAGMLDSNNEVLVAKIFVPFQQTIDTVIFEVTTGQTSATCEAGLYDSSGNLLTVGTTIDCSSASVKTQDITDVIIGPGFYWVALTSSDATVAFLRVSSTADAAITTLKNTGTVQIGTAANASTAGELPATLGAISGDAEAKPVIKFQG